MWKVRQARCVRCLIRRLRLQMAHAWDKCSASGCTGLRGMGQAGLKGGALEAEVGLVYKNIHQAETGIFCGVEAAYACADPACFEGSLACIPSGWGTASSTTHGQILCACVCSLPRQPACQTGWSKLDHASGNAVPRQSRACRASRHPGLDCGRQFLKKCYPFLCKCAAKNRRMLPLLGPSLAFRGLGLYHLTSSSPTISGQGGLHLVCICILWSISFLDGTCVSMHMVSHVRGPDGTPMMPPCNLSSK